MADQWFWIGIWMPLLWRVTLSVLFSGKVYTRLGLVAYATPLICVAIGCCVVAIKNGGYELFTPILICGS